MTFILIGMPNCMVPIPPSQPHRKRIPNVHALVRTAELTTLPNRFLEPNHDCSDPILQRLTRW